MNQRFNGLSFVIDLGGFAVKVQKFSLDITDNSAVAKRDGRPDGYLLGDLEGAGTITVDQGGLKTILNSVKTSFQELEPFDINSYAKVGSEEVRVEAFGCKLKISKVLDIDKSSADETMFELPFDITSPDFVKINGKPYGATIAE